MPLPESGASAFGHGMRMGSLSLCAQPEISTQSLKKSALQRICDHELLITIAWQAVPGDTDKLMRSSSPKRMLAIHHARHPPVGIA